MISDKQKKHIELQVKKYWHSAGNWWVDDQGMVQVKGIFRSKEKHVPRGELPVQFGEVVGDLNLGNMGLVTLKGAPKKVTGWLFLSENPLKNLLHAPQHVRTLIMFNMTELQELTGCPSQLHDISIQNAPKLKSLAGLNESPHSINSVTLADCDPDLPLLRTLVSGHVTIEKNWRQNMEIMQILNDERWMGKGKSHALNCALALKQAGFGNNASW